MVLSALFALFIPANTINEVCDLDFSANNLWFVTGWVAMLLILASVLMWRSALSWRRAVSSERGVHYSLSEEDQEAKNLVMGLSAFVALRLMIQVVNCVTSLIDKDANVYAQMLIIEGLLEHRQGVVLLFLFVGVMPVKRSASLILAWVSERRHVYGRYLSMSTLVPFAVHDPTISFLVETPEQASLEPTRLRPMSLNLESERAAGEHRQGICAVECVTAHLRGFEEDSRSEVNLTCSTGTVTSMFVCTCETGRYMNVSGVSACLYCPTGTIADETASTTCRACALGSSIATLGTVMCDNCSVGSYQKVSGQTSCVSCNSGFFVPSIGQTACQACEPGFANDQEEANLCYCCSSGMYSSLYNQTSLSRFWSSRSDVGHRRWPGFRRHGATQCLAELELPFSVVVTSSVIHGNLV